MVRSDKPLPLKDFDEMSYERMAKEQSMKATSYGSARDETESTSSVVAEIRCYLEELVNDFRREQPSQPGIEVDSSQEIVESVFTIMAGRKFTHLTKNRSRVYRAAILDLLVEDAKAGRPLRFYYDIGGAYRAGIDDQQRELSFSPALGEFFLLRQIKLFDNLVCAVYPPGTKFSLVIDNLCALLVNDIRVDKSLGYCEELREIIRQLNLEEKVDLFVESEIFRPEDYKTDTTGVSMSPPSLGAIENVSRFLGRNCDSSEAIERMARYAVVSEQTDSKINSIIDGVRMTQRATPATFGFRSVPGGDSRMQTGEVILTYYQDGRIKPRLVTSQSKGSTSIQQIDVSDLIPLPCRQVGYEIVSK